MKFVLYCQYIFVNLAEETTIDISTTVSNIAKSDCEKVQGALKQATASQLQIANDKISVGNL